LSELSREGARAPIAVVVAVNVVVIQVTFLFQVTSLMQELQPA
tara:strand:+ start:822 stop:950 length:129 start_codon:yes stop_codon:yes gene_type:complete